MKLYLIWNPINVNGNFSLGINTIINLQLPGEHSSCGNSLEDSGFTYDPNTFMQNNSKSNKFWYAHYSSKPTTEL
jgi:hypothetical protein